MYNFVRKTKHGKYDFTAKSKKHSSITRLKNNVLGKLQMRRKPQEDKVTLKAVVYHDDFFNRIKITRRKQLSNLKNQHLKNKVQEKDRQITQLHEQAKVFDIAQREHQIVICRLQEQSDEKEIKLTEQRTRFELEISELQCVLEEHRDTIKRQDTKILEMELESSQATHINHESPAVSPTEYDRKLDQCDAGVDLEIQIKPLQAQITALENELFSIRQKSEEILTININNCNGVAIGDNTDINMTEDAVGIEMSAEVKRNLDAISRACQCMNDNLLKHTNAMARIDSGIADLASNPVAKDAGLSTGLGDMRNLIQRTCNQQEFPIHSGLASTGISGLTSGNPNGYTIQSYQGERNYQCHLELIPKMYPMIEKIYERVNTHSKESL